MAGYVSPLILPDYWEAGPEGAPRTYGAAGQAKFEAIAGSGAKPIDGVTGEKGYKGTWAPAGASKAKGGLKAA